MTLADDLTAEIDRVRNKFLPKAPNGMMWLIARKACREAEDAITFNDEGRQSFYLKLLRRYAII